MALKKLKQMVAGSAGEILEQLQMEMVEKDKHIRNFAQEIDRLESEKKRWIASASTGDSAQDQVRGHRPVCQISHFHYQSSEDVILQIHLIVRENTID